MRYVYLVEIEVTPQRYRYVTYLRMKDVNAARKNFPQSKVYRMSRGLYKDGYDPYGWDAPTFKVQATRIV